MPNIQFVKKFICGKISLHCKNCGKLGGKCEKTHPNQGFHFLSFVKRDKLGVLLLTSRHNFWLKECGCSLRSNNEDKCNIHLEKEENVSQFFCRRIVAYKKTFFVFAESFAFRLKNPNKSAIIIYCIIMGKRKGKYDGR